MTYKSDGTVKARGESELQEGKITRTEIFDSEGRLEFIEHPIYDENGKITGNKRLLPDGNPYPYKYAVYGVAAFGGLEAMKGDIEKIQEVVSLIDRQYPILDIVFLSKDRVEVQTGIVKGPLNARGRFHNLKKQGNLWQNADKEGMVHSWVS